MQDQLPGLRAQALHLDAAYRSLESARRMLTDAWIKCDCTLCVAERGQECPLFKLSAPLSVARQELWDAGANGIAGPDYYTIAIPFTAQHATEWHPTTDSGPFAVLTRGAFHTLSEARAWGIKYLNKLAPTAWTIRSVTFDHEAESDRFVDVEVHP